YVNEEAVELPVLAAPEEPIRLQEFKPGDPRLATRRRIAKEQFGEIAYYSDTQGYITCPGEEHHQTPTEDTHCRVHLDGAPNIHCFHNSCAEAREEANRQLRFRITEEEM